jgi:hypothetical protein
VKLTLALSAAVAALVALQAAAAAELPLRHARPAPAAKKCGIDGQEGVILPGSEICMRLGGYVNAQVTVGTAGKSRQVGAP